jgi:hypothetical protein
VEKSGKKWKKVEKSGKKWKKLIFTETNINKL